MARGRRGGIDLPRMASSGGIAAQMLLRMGVRAPLLTLGLSTEAHQQWSETFHGGWTYADLKVHSVHLPVISADISSCFPLVAHHLGWWGLVCAESVQLHDATDDLRQLCLRAIADPRSVLDPGVWSTMGCTRAEVIPSGEVWPVEVEDDLRPDGRLEFVPVTSPLRTFHFAWPDVVYASVQSGRVPIIVEATTLTPVGRQEGIVGTLPVVPGLTLRGDEDPLLSLVTFRRMMKQRGDARSACLLHAVANSLVYGNLCRFDDVRIQVGDNWVTAEKPGPWNCMPIASTVTAGSHLLLGVLDQLVQTAGGSVIYRDTDSSIIPASSDGGETVLPGAESIALLPWQTVDAILAAFDPLSPDLDWPVWKVTRGSSSTPLQAVVWGPKRHVEFLGGDEA